MESFVDRAEDKSSIVPEPVAGLSMSSSILNPRVVLQGDRPRLLSGVGTPSSGAGYWLVW